MQNLCLLPNQNLLFPESELRDFLSLDETILNIELAGFIRSAAGLFEKYTGHILMPKNYKISLSMLENNIFIFPIYPIISIISCLSDDHEVSSEFYSYHAGKFTLDPFYLSSKIDVTYQAGYNDPSLIDHGIKTAILYTAADLYFYQMNETMGMKNISDIPFKNGFDLYKLINL